MKVYRRYLKIEPLHTEEYIAYLKGKVSLTSDRTNAWEQHRRKSGTSLVLLARLLCFTDFVGLLIADKYKPRKTGNAAMSA